MGILNLRNLVGGGGGGVEISETIRRPWAHNPDPFVRDGCTYVDRSYVHALLASNYPVFYEKCAEFYGASFFIPRNAMDTANTFKHLDSNVNNTTIVAIGTTPGGVGVVRRSTNDGASFAGVTVTTSPANSDLHAVHYNATLNKWFIFYSSTRCLMSTDGGATWTDTAITGFGNTFTSTGLHQIRVFSLGSTVVFASALGVWTSTNGGTTWIQQTTGNTDGGKLTKGNGLLVLMKYATSNNVYSTADGLTWTLRGSISGYVDDGSGGSGVVDANKFWQYSYGVVWDGTRWVIGLGGDFRVQIDSGVPKTDPMPSTPPTVPTHTTRHYGYTSGTGGGLWSWTYVSGTINSYVSNWETSGAANWFCEYERDGLYNGPIGGFGCMVAITSTFNGPTSAGIFDVYAANFWTQLIASTGGYTWGNIVKSTNIDHTGNPFSHNGPIKLQPTQDDKIYTLSTTGANYTANVTNGGSEPAISLPVFNTGISGEGYQFTRIK